MGKNYSYRITLDEDNPKHMRVAALLDKLGRGELRQYIVDSIILAETVTSQQKGIEESSNVSVVPRVYGQCRASQAGTAKNIQCVVEQPVASQANAELLIPIMKQQDEQVDQQAWARDSLAAWGAVPKAED